MHVHSHHRRSCAGRHAMRRGGFGGHGFDAPGDRDADRGGRDGGPGRRRVFDGGELRLVLLALIADAPRHGYDCIRAIEARTGGAYAPSPGIVYPTLTLLADMEQIAEAPSEGSRKAFAITEAGRAALAEKAQEVAALLERLDALGVVREQTDGAPVRRAMHNLRAVLRHRLVRDDVSADTIHAAVALIDEAAQRIERL